MASMGAPCSDVASKRGPRSPIPCAALVPTYSLEPLLMRSLNEGVHMVRKPVLPMTFLTSQAQGLLNTRPTGPVRLVVSLLGVPNTAVLDSLSPAVHVALALRAVRLSAMTGRLRRAMT